MTSSRPFEAPSGPSTLRVERQNAQMRGTVGLHAGSLALYLNALSVTSCAGLRDVAPHSGGAGFIPPRLRPLLLPLPGRRGLLSRQSETASPRFRFRAV